MSLRQWSWAFPLASLTLAASTCLGQTAKTGENPPPAAERPVGERVGEKVDGAVQSLKRGVSSASEAIRDQYEKARTSVHDMGVAARIYGRVHWDKTLTNAKIDVDVQKGGVAVLKGTVSDAVARAKAVELAQDTVGVARVVDQLSIQTTTSGTVPARVTPAKP